jgi:broad specificity phosphatase PhoE
MLELTIVRHGQSYGNLDWAFGPDTNLTKVGRDQATRLGKWLADQDYAFTAIYASTLCRARQTAQIINHHYGLRINFDPDLRETEQPYLDTLPRRPEPLGADPAPPFSPEYEKMRERVQRATTRILADNLAGHVLVVAHAGTCGTMIRGILRTQSVLVRTELAALHSLRWDDGRWTLRFLNRQDHLNMDSPPVTGF